MKMCLAQGQIINNKLPILRILRKNFLTTPSGLQSSNFLDNLEMVDGAVDSF